MNLAEKIEGNRLAYWFTKLFSNKPWQNHSKSHKWYKKHQHRIWRRWSKKNINEDSNNPMYNRYSGWEY